MRQKCSNVCSKKWLTRTYVCLIIELAQEIQITRYKNCSLPRIIGVGSTSSKQTAIYIIILSHKLILGEMGLRNIAEYYA